MNDLEEAITRLAAWLRDHGGQYASSNRTTRAFVDDVTLVVTAAREASAIKSSGIKMAALCARLHGRDDIPLAVKEEAIALANEFKTIIVEPLPTKQR